MEEKYKINLHILEACNFRCRQCFSKFGTEKLLPVEDWKKIIDNCIAGADVTEFNIAGGEPMLYPGLTELVKYMKASYVLIDSNGCLLDNAVDEITPVAVCDCLREDFAEGLRRLTLDMEKYEARYKLA